MANQSMRRWSWLGNLGGLFRAKRTEAGGQRRARRRRLTVERLEGRDLLSATVFPSIGGTAFYDVTQDGLTADDLRLPGISVSLFRDGGNGQFNGNSGGDDQLLATTLTDNAGKYRFDNLSTGTYFVQQSPAPGFVLPTGMDVGKVVVTSNDTVGVTGRTIDSFSTTTQWVGASLRTGKVASSSMNAGEALGGHRDLYVQLTSARGSMSLGANADVPGMLDFASGSASNGLYWVTWDGQGGDPQVLNPTGLGQIDLTSEGASTGLKLILGADHEGGFVLINAYSDAGNWSQASVAIPNTDDGTANEEIFVPFSSFVRRGGNGADFTKVGAMRMEINGVSAADGQVGPITAIGPKVFTQDFANVARTDLAIVKSHTPEPAIAGNQLTYTLTATNNGPSKATGVTITDPLPAGVTYISASTSQGSFSFANGTLTINLGSLSSGATATTTIAVNVAPGLTGTISNTATITGNEPDPRLDNNTSTTTTQINAQVDLAIVKTDSPDPVVAGRQLTYTFRTTNNGPSNATGVTITDPLPAGVTYVSATSSQGTVSSAGGTLTVTLGNLAAGASATTAVTVTVEPGTTGILTNTATVHGNQTDPIPGNNTSTATTTVTPEIDLEIRKVGQPDPVIAGNQLTYTLTTTNKGPSSATGVKIVDTLPAGVTYTSSSGQGSVSIAGGIVTVNLGNLATGATVTTTIVVTVGAKTTGPLTNVAVVSGNETETTLANNRAEAINRVDVPVEPQGDPIIDLSIQKVGTPEPVTVGSNLTYTLSIANLTTTNEENNTTATNVIVSDTLPAGVTVLSVTSSQGTASATGGTVQASLGNIAGGGTATVVIVVRVDSAATGSITNTATVHGNEEDPDPTNNTSHWDTRVVSLPSKRWFLSSRLRTQR